MGGLDGGFVGGFDGGLVGGLDGGSDGGVEGGVDGEPALAIVTMRPPQPMTPATHAIVTADEKSVRGRQQIVICLTFKIDIRKLRTWLSLTQIDRATLRTLGRRTSPILMGVRNPDRRQKAPTSREILQA